MLSIITVVRNDKEGLEKTCNSLKKQQLQNFQWIIQDGDSSDGTLEYAENIKGFNSFIFNSGKDKGIYDAMNKAAGSATEKYLLFLNAGDELFDDQVTLCLSQDDNLLRETSNVGIYCGNYILVTEKKYEIFRKSRSSDCLPCSMPTSHQSMLFDNRLFKSNQYSLDYKIKGDQELVIRMWAKGLKIININSTISKFHLGGMSFVNPMLAFKEHYHMLRKSGKLGILSSCACVAKLIIRNRVRWLINYLVRFQMNDAY